MNALDAKLLFAVTLAALLASVLARVVAWRFRVAMKALMQQPLPPRPAAAGGSGSAAARVRATAAAPQPVTVGDNRRAAWRVSLLLIGLTLALALASAVITLLLPSTGTVLTLRRALVLTLAQTWPAVPALALLWRWPAWQSVFAFALWALACALLFALNSDAGHAFREAFVYLFVDSSFALLWALLLCAGAATRAVAPWLFLPLLALAVAAIAGLDLLQAAVQGESGWIRALVGTFGAWPTFLLFMLLPCALLAWPASRVGGMLAAAYRRHWLSELTLLFGVLSALALLQRALLGFVASNGLSLALLVPLVLVVPGMRLGRRVPAVRPPALLVLRVFQRDRAVSALFDRVIERWRLTGNTMLIAGTDLLERTIDAEDIYGFLGRRLRDRFVLQPGELDARLAAFDLERDLDGRHRINEVYCHDSTWRQALDALVARADVVLMDLRSFQRRNVGCRHELGVLARAAHLGRVVVLVDEHTDLADAKAAAAGASPGRFEWVDITHAGRGLARQVLARLFVAG